MARQYNSHEVHPVTYLFVGFLLLLTLVGISPLFKNTPRTYNTSAYVISTPTRTPTPVCTSSGNCLRSGTTCCSGIRVFDRYCASGARCIAPRTTPTVIACTTNGLCRRSGSSCCSGRQVYEPDCATASKCVAAVTRTPTRSRTPTPR